MSESQKQANNDDAQFYFIGNAHSGNHLFNLINQLNVGIAQVNLEGKFIQVNERFCSITGYSREELSQITMMSITHPDDRLKNSEMFIQCIKEGKPFFVEKRYIRKDGSIAWVNNSVSLVTDELTGIRLITAVCIDITASKEQEETINQLLANEQQLRAQTELERTKIYNMFMQAPASIALLKGPNHVFEFANPLYMQLVGNDRDIIGKPVAESLPEVRWQGYVALLDKVYETGEPYVGAELKVYLDRNKNGNIEEIYLNFVYQPWRDVDGAISGILVHATDVTEQVMARKKIEESEARFRNLVIEAPSAKALLKGPDFILEIANAAMLNIWDRDESVIGLPLLDFMPELIDQPFPSILKHVYETGETHSQKGSMVLLKRHGNIEEVYMDFSYKALKGTNNEVYAILVVATDVTDRILNKNKLEQHNEELIQLANAMPQVVWMAEPDGTVTYYNNRVGELEGAYKKEDGSWAWEGLTHPEDLEATINAWANAVEHGVGYDIQHRVKRKGSGYQWHLSRAIPHKDEEGKILKWYGTATNIHDQITSAELVRESEERFRSLADQSPLFIYIVEPNEEATMSYFNKTWLDYTGQTFEEAIGNAWNFVVHPDDVQKVYDIFIPAFQLRIPYTLPGVRVKRKDGSYRWHFFKGTPRYLPNGEFIGYVGVGIDIHEEKLADERFKTLAETLPQLIWMTDEKGSHQFASNRWSEYAGFDPCVSSNWEEFIHPLDMRSLMNAWNRSLTTGDNYFSEARLKNNQGEYRWHYVHGIPIKGDDGSITNWIGSFTDFHEKKNEADKLESLVAMRTSELQRSNEELEQFAHVASHDLKEPLRKIKIFTSRFMDEFGNGLAGNAKLYLEKIDKSVNRMFAMVEGVLQYSSLNAIQAPTVDVDLKIVFENIESDLELMIQQKNAVIEYDDLPVINGQPLLIHQLFYNILNNSLKFSRQEVDPLIQVLYSRKKNMAGNEFHEIIVKDNGIGFSNDHMDKIFKAFTRLNTKDKFEGTGLGLALCKKIVDRHNGYILAEGKENEGATFIIGLPV